ncbi:hypothetical protein ACH4C2_16940 [Streptomyces sp. NPDC018057]|uniref:hypothetical protein n=1 Tax=unclassified Streptomyces TaxID=2593676 RepID=UPI0037994967
MAALLVSPRVIEGLEDTLAVAGHRLRTAEGTPGPGTPTAEAGRRPGPGQK